MTQLLKLSLFSLAVLSHPVRAEIVQKGLDEKTSSKINQAVLNLEKSFEKQKTIGSSWIANGQNWQKIQKQFEFVTRSCEPERMAEMAQKKKTGQAKAEKFIQSFGPIMALPSFTEEEKKNACAIVAKLEDLKKARSGLGQIRIEAKKTGFISDLKSGVIELQQGYESYSMLGEASAFFATEVSCDGKVDPGPTLRTGIKRLSAFYKDTLELISNISEIEKRTDQLIAELNRTDASTCPQAQAETQTQPDASTASSEGTADAPTTSDTSTATQ